MADSFKQGFREIEDFLDFIEEDLENIRRVKNHCEDQDLDVEFTIHPKSETCEESAEHSDMETRQIIKTLLFKTENDFVAVLCPGDKRVDEQKLEEITGSSIRMANPQEVKEETGYVVGGVSPFDLDLTVYMEESILKEEKVRPAAGSRVVGVETTPETLRETNNAEKHSIAK